MTTRFKKWLQSPIYEDENRARYARFLNTLVIASTVLISIFILLLVLIGIADNRQLIMLSIGLAFNIVIKTLLNAKILQPAIILFQLFTWIAVTIAPLSDTGLYSPSMTAFVLIILFSSIFNQRYAPIYATIVTVATSLGFVFLMRSDVIGTVPNHPITPEIAFFAYTITFIVVGIVTYLSSNLILDSFRKLELTQGESLQTTSYLKRAEAIAHLGNFEFDLTSQDITWSDEVYRIFGIPIGQNVSLETYKKLLSPEMYENVMAKVNVTVETGAPYELEHPFQLEDGTHKEVYAIGNPITDDRGRVVKIFGIIQDITERKRSERVQNVLLNISRARYEDKTLADLLEYIIQQLGSLVDVRNCYIALYDSDTELYSFPYGTDEYDTNWSPERLDDSLTDYVRKTQEAQLITETEHLRLTATTNLKFMGTWSKVWLGAPLKIQQRTIGVIVIQDYDDINAYQQSDLDLLAYVAENIASIIESKQAEEERIALELQMRQTEFLKEFISHMTHDIKTPLSVIKNSTYLLDNIADPSRQREYIGRINYQLERLDRIIEDILTISRLDHIDQSSRQVVKLNLLIEHIANQLHPKIERKNITLIRDVAPDIPPLMANESDLTRALLNLIENAMHYTNTGGQVTVTCKRTDADIIFQVQDTGIGIHHDDLSHIFERFYRADNARDFEHGTGLGLAIVKRVIELHHGTITVDSKLDVGTTFMVKFKIDDLPQKPKIDQLT